MNNDINFLELEQQNEPEYEKNYTENGIKDTLGEVLSVKDGVVLCKGLKNCGYGEMVTINNTDGMVLNLEKDTVGIVIFGNDNNVRVGDEVRKSGDLMKIKFNIELLGRVVNALGVQLMVQIKRFGRVCRIIC